MPNMDSFLSISILFLTSQPTMKIHLKVGNVNWTKRINDNKRKAIAFFSLQFSPPSSLPICFGCRDFFSPFFCLIFWGALKPLKRENRLGRKREKEGKLLLLFSLSFGNKKHIHNNLQFLNVCVATLYGTLDECAEDEDDVQHFRRGINAASWLWILICGCNVQDHHVGITTSRSQRKCWVKVGTCRGRYAP